MNKREREFWNMGTTLEQRIAKLEAFMKDAQKRKLVTRVERLEKIVNKKPPKKEK